ncbi:hypothetical protein [Streptomyces sp. NBC_00091]|uniref:hypothetical protein n=1 Tax=Streptomyces sp. NBC_00091 TaxID=2975648 RepID=UPI0022546922|nr:hypothetical protein [Streptomyces sp. NBC_00091]MCX5378801.1 hypothetical protein [Streptomyces sp. NBC_00091]
MTDRITHSCICEMLGIETANVPVERVAARFEPSTGLLDRAQAGWERFLDTFEGASNE